MSIKIPIVSDFDGKGIKRAVAEFKSLEKASDKAQLAIRKSAAPTAAALATLGVFAFKAAQKASDLNEETSKAKQIFGEASKSIIDFSNTASTQIGQSRTEALKAAGTFGVLGKAAGLTGNDLTQMSIKFTKLASDLASFNNTSPEDAVLALGAGLRGEAEPLRRYGVLLDDLTLRNKAVELQLVKTTKEALTPANKSLAAQAVILEKTALQQGNFALTSKDAANQQRILTARLEDFQTQLGTILLPVLTDTVKVLNDYAAVILDLTKKTDNANESTGKWLDRFAKLATTVLPFAQAMKGLGIVVGKVNEFVGKQARSLEANEEVTSRVTNKIKEAAAFESLLKTEIDLTTSSTKKSSEETKKKSAALEKAAAKTKKLKEALKDAKTALRDDFAEALEKAQDKLKTAENAFDDFAMSVCSAITNAFNFGTAQDKAAKNSKNLTDALEEQQKAQKELKNAFDFGTFEDITKAQEDLAEASKKVTEAQNQPMTFFDNLRSEAQKARDFGVLVNRLVAAGLSEAALSQVLEAGVDAGSSIANELLSGAGNILEANQLVADLQAIADMAGRNSAAKFYDAGVLAGQSLVAGVQAAINSFELRLNTPGLTASDVNTMRGQFNSSSVVMPNAALDPAAFNSWIDLNLGNIMGNMQFLASGGVVTGPTMAVIGEAGPEAVIPLDRFGDMGGTTNVTINVQGSDPNAVVDALRRYMRQNGSVPITVSTP